METIEFIKQPNGTIQVNAIKCGMKFEGIAFIHEPNSPNPMINIPNPIGVLAIIQILISCIEEIKQKYLVEEEFKEWKLRGSQTSLMNAYSALVEFLEAVQNEN